GFFQHLFGHEWELTKSPGGAHQWVAKEATATVPDAHDRTKKHRPTMLTTDLSLRFDPSYNGSRGASWATPISLPMHLLAPGSSSHTATWGRARAISDQK